MKINKKKSKKWIKRKQMQSKSIKFSVGAGGAVQWYKHEKHGLRKLFHGSAQCISKKSVQWVAKRRTSVVHYPSRYFRKLRFSPRFPSDKRTDDLRNPCTPVASLFFFFFFFFFFVRLWLLSVYSFILTSKCSGSKFFFNAEKWGKSIAF